jgi:hypothetical protein
MAVGDIATVDNVHAGGLAASVDLMAGRLSPATDMGVDAKLGWIADTPTPARRSPDGSCPCGAKSAISF